MSTQVLLKNNIRIYVSDYTAIANIAINKQQTTPTSSLFLGVAISVFAPLGIMQKQGYVQAIYKTNSALNNIIIESHFNGHVRAMIDNRNIASEYDNDIQKLNTIPLQILTGASGNLKIIKNINGKQFGSEVKIVKGDFVTDLAYYFDQSDQIYSAVLSDVKLKNKLQFAKVVSVIFQLLPGYTEQDITWVEKQVQKKLSTFTNLEQYIAHLNATQLLQIDNKWQCKCSESRSRKIADTLSKGEKSELIKEHGKIEIVCNFCLTKYHFKH